jgi:transposase-like protein
MTKHKTEDYKNSAVKYYLNNDKGDGYKRTCKIFDCKKSTLRDWIKRYQTSKNLTRRNRKQMSYKITKPQVNTALELLKQNENHQQEEENFKFINNILKIYLLFKYIVMRLKSELYKKEQEEIVDKIISILDLENNNIINLCDLDNKYDKQKQIMELIPEIRKYYSFNGIKAVGEPSKIKRPWLSIIKHLTKEKYNLESKEYRFFNEKENNYLRTQKYIFTKL